MGVVTRRAEAQRRRRVSAFTTPIAEATPPFRYAIRSGALCQNAATKRLLGLLQRNKGVEGTSVG
jgi:hypothetical protein